MNQQMNNANDKKYASNTAPSYRGSLGYLVIGGTIGATLALLFAPKPGRQLRGEIADVSRKGLDTAKEKTGEIAQTVKEKADAAYNFASRKVGAGADTAIDTAVSAADSWADKQDANRAEADKGFRPPSSIG
jgi:gas vesicle protein